MRDLTVPGNPPRSFHPSDHPRSLPHAIALLRHKDNLLIETHHGSEMACKSLRAFSP